MNDIIKTLNFTTIEFARLVKGDTHWITQTVPRKLSQEQAVRYLKKQYHEQLVIQSVRVLTYHKRVYSLPVPVFIQAAKLVSEETTDGSDA